MSSGSGRVIAAVDAAGAGADSSAAVLEDLKELVRSLHRHHDEEHARDDGDEGDTGNCRPVLLSIRKFVPVLGKLLDSGSRDVVLYVCGLLRLLIDAQVCPQSTAVFDQGRFERIAPLVVPLFALVADPQYARAVDDSGDTTMPLAATSDTGSSPLAVLRGLLWLMGFEDLRAHGAFLAGAVTLLEDNFVLSAIIRRRAAWPARVVLRGFEALLSGSNICEGDNMENIAIVVGSAEHLHSLQSSLLALLVAFVEHPSGAVYFSGSRAYVRLWSVVATVVARVSEFPVHVATTAVKLLLGMLRHGQPLRFQRSVLAKALLGLCNPTDEFSAASAPDLHEAAAKCLQVLLARGSWSSFANHDTARGDSLLIECAPAVVAALCAQARSQYASSCMKAVVLDALLSILLLGEGVGCRVLCEALLCASISQLRSGVVALLQILVDKWPAVLELSASAVHIEDPAGSKRRRLRFDDRISRRRVALEVDGDSVAHASPAHSSSSSAPHDPMNMNKGVTLTQGSAEETEHSVLCVLSTVLSVALNRLPPPMEHSQLLVSRAAEDAVFSLHILDVCMQALLCAPEFGPAIRTGDEMGALKPFPQCDASVVPPVYGVDVLPAVLEENRAGAANLASDGARGRLRKQLLLRGMTVVDNELSALLSSLRPKGAGRRQRGEVTDGGDGGDDGLGLIVRVRAALSVAIEIARHAQPRENDRLLAAVTPLASNFHLLWDLPGATMWPGERGFTMSTVRPFASQLHTVPAVSAQSWMHGCLKSTETARDGASPSLDVTCMPLLQQALVLFGALLPRCGASQHGRIGVADIVRDVRGACDDAAAWDGTGDVLWRSGTRSDGASTRRSTLSLRSLVACVASSVRHDDAAVRIVGVSLLPWCVEGVFVEVVSTFKEESAASIGVSRQDLQRMVLHIADAVSGVLVPHIDDRNVEIRRAIASSIGAFGVALQRCAHAIDEIRPVSVPASERSAGTQRSRRKSPRRSGRATIAAGGLDEAALCGGVALWSRFLRFAEDKDDVVRSTFLRSLRYAIEGSLRDDAAQRHSSLLAVFSAIGSTPSGVAMAVAQEFGKLMSAASQDPESLSRAASSGSDEAESSGDANLAPRPTGASSMTIGSAGFVSLKTVAKRLWSLLRSAVEPDAFAAIACALCELGLLAIAHLPAQDAPRDMWRRGALQGNQAAGLGLGSGSAHSADAAVHVLSGALVPLLEAWSDPVASVTSRWTACDELHRLAKARRCSLYMLLEETREDVYPRVLPKLLAGGDEVLDDFVQELLGGELTTESFLASKLNMVLPALFATASKDLIEALALRLRGHVEATEELPVLDDGSETAARQVMRMIRGYVDYILARLLLNGARDPASVTESWTLFATYLRELPDFSLSEIIVEATPQVLALLVWQLGRPREDAREVAERALSALAQMVDGSKRLPKLTPPKPRARARSRRSQTGSSRRSTLDEFVSAGSTSLQSDVDHIVSLSQRARDAGEGSEVSTGSRLPLLIRRHFLFLLKKLEPQTSQASKHVSDRIRALRCIFHLLQTMDGDVDTFAPQVLATLRASIQDAGLAPVACQVWLFFVQQLSDATLQTSLSTMVVSLLPLIQQSDVGSDSADATSARDDALRILHFCIVERRSAVAASLKQIPFVPELPELRKVTTVISDEVGELPLSDTLQEMASLLHHNSVAVQLMALSEMTKLLGTKTPELHGMIATPQNECHVAISKVLRSLLRLSRQASDPRVKLACATCLGEIGAIDPARLPVDTSRRRNVQSPSMRDLAVKLISEHFVKGLRSAASAATQDRFAFAIQETLRVLDSMVGGGPDEEHEISGAPAKRRRRVQGSGGSTPPPEGKEPPHKRPFPAALRALFADDVIDAIEPLWSTGYSSTEKEMSAKMPFYNPSTASKPLAFESWLARWTRYLIFKCKGPDAWLFRACRGVLRYAKEAAMLLLPEVVLNVLLNSSDDVISSGIVHEIVAVLSDTSDGSRSALPLPASQRGTSSLHHTGNALQQKATQAVFSLLDTLTERVGARNQSKDGRRVASLTPETAAVAGLRARIPLELLADAATRVSAHARAYFFMETLLRQERRHDRGSALVDTLLSRRGAESDPENSADVGRAALGGVIFDVVPYTREELGRLQRTYSHLDEPDGLSGIAALRSRLLFDGGNKLDIGASKSQNRGGAGAAGAQSPSSPGDTEELATTLHERLIDYEHDGMWDEALLCCEQSLLLSANSTASKSSSGGRPGEPAPQSSGRWGDQEDIETQKVLHGTVLRCLQHLGHMETALQRAIGVVYRSSELASTVAPYAVEASWRLGRWDALEELLSYRSGSLGLRALASVTERGSSLGSAVRATSVSQPRFTIPFSDRGFSPTSQGGTVTDPTARTYEISVGVAMLALRTLVDLSSGLGESDSHTGVVAEMLRERAESRRETARLAFRTALRTARLDVMGSMAAASMESYQRSYPSMLKLHALRDLEHAEQLVTLASSEEKLERLDEWGWSERLQYTVSSVQLQEPLCAVNRTVYAMHGLVEREADTWLAIGELARKAGHYHSASNALLQASGLRTGGARIATAKLLYKKGDAHRAIEELEPVAIDAVKLVEKYSGASQADKRLEAERLLLTTNWLHEAGNKSREELFERYRAVTKLQPQWEDGHFYLGKYWDHMLRRVLAEISTSRRSVVQSLHESSMLLASHVVKFYGRALNRGHSFIFQSLPRLLTVWFNAASRVAAVADAAGDGRRSRSAPVAATEAELRYFDKLIAEVTQLAAQLPVYEWYTAFPQLLSRICHRHEKTRLLILDICAIILRTYPERAYWQFMGLYKSRNSSRVNMATQVFHRLKAAKGGSVDMVNITGELFDQLIYTARAKSDKQTMPLNISWRRANKLVLPIQSALTAVLPAEPGAPAEEAFPNDDPMIRSFASTADVMNSKERPKRITIRDTHGNSVPFLNKSERKGDLRKDARMMELNTTLNRLLQRDANARRRKLRLRTYAVVCLDEICGLMEWVQGTTSFRSLVSEVYASEGLPSVIKTTRAVRRNFEALQTIQDDRTRGRKYRSEILPQFPAVFHKWFHLAFPDTTTWFENRCIFTRSAAVWSMVGHIVGLGDRHGENILIDASIGECVHVDFDCLFDKGLTLLRPEVVPFRLSPNMLDAFGLSGYEGVFRGVAEATLSVLRTNKETLISVLEPFIYDPLVEWDKGARDSSATAKETEHTEGLRSLRRLSKRLDGHYNYGRRVEASATPLSVRGQVENLVKEATCDANMSAMYIGWLPYM